MRTKFILLGSLMMIGLIGNVSAQSFWGCPMGWNGQYWAGWAILSWLMSLSVLALIIAAIYWLIKSANKKVKGGR